MDQNIRNFKDFLQLYNRITELCFSQCVDNFFNRSLANEESVCVDSCVQKFIKFNQRLMGVYVEVQTAINERRMTELDAIAAQQQQQQQEQINASSQSQIESESPSSSSSTEKPITLGENTNSNLLQV